MKKLLLFHFLMISIFMIESHGQNLEQLPTFNSNASTLRVNAINEFGDVDLPEIDDLNILYGTTLYALSYRDIFDSTDLSISIVSNSRPTLVTLEIDTLSEVLLFKFPSDSLGSANISLLAINGSHHIDIDFTVNVIYNAIPIHQQEEISLDGISSQIFPDLGGPVYSADDIDVPENETWNITRFTAKGTKNSNNIDSVKFVIFDALDDSTQLPDQLIFETTLLPTSDSTDANLVLDFPTPIQLTEGKYWVSVAPILDFNGNNGRWFWARTTNSYGINYHLKDSKNLFGAGLTNWTNGDFFNKDLINLNFSIYGSTQNDDTPPLTLNTDLQLDFIDKKQIKLSWENDEQFFGYIIKKGANPDNLNEIIKIISSEDSIETFIDYNTSPIPENTKIYYSVEGINSSGSSSAIIDSIKTRPQVPIFFLPSINSNSIAVTWLNIRADQVVLDLSIDENFNSFIVQDSITNWDSYGMTFNNLNPNTTYYIRAHSRNEFGNSNYNSTVSLLTKTGTPTSSSASHITENSFQANWNSISSDNYIIDVATDLLFTSLIVEDSVVSNTTNNILLNNLQSNKSYYYRIAASNESGVSEYSESVHIKTTPLIPVATDASNITTNSFQANWNTSDTDNYKIDVSLDSDFTNFVLQNEEVSSSTNSLEITELSSNTTYYYRVVATNEFSSSDYSDVISVTTTNVTSSISFYLDTQINVFPNPSSNLLNVSYSDNFFGNINLKVINIYGGVIFEDSFYKNNTTFSKILDISQFQNGNYILILETENAMSFVKFIKE